MPRIDVARSIARAFSCCRKGTGHFFQGSRCLLLPGLFDGDTGDRVVDTLDGDAGPNVDRLVGLPPIPTVLTGRLESRVAGPRAAGPPEGTIPDSISLSARSTFGRLKLLLPNGPTIPAAAPAKS